MAEFIYTMKNVRRAIGEKVILDNVTMAFYPGAKIGVVGPNGAGKSSLLKIMAGIDQPNNGEAFLQPGATVGILLQEPPLNEEKTVRGNVEEGLGELFEKKQRFEEIAEEMATNYSDELMEEMGKLQEELDAADAWEIDSKIEQAMEALRCPPSDAPVTNLSGGDRRVALAKLLLSEPDLLLLDEPTNHLDAESVLWLERHLQTYPGAVLAITHDRYFLDNVAEWICEVDRGQLYPYEGNYSTYLEKKAERLEVAGKKDQKLQKRLKKELEWVRSSPKARQAKNKARLERYEEMAAEAEKYRKLDFEEDQNRENINPEETVWEVVSDGLDYIHVGQNEMPSRAYLSAFGFKGADQQKPSKVLSGGERNRLNLALTLKQGGNLILLDEPTNDLDVETLGSLENALQAFPGCAVVISHDRWFLDRTCTHILAWEGNVEEGKWFWFEGNFGDYEKNKVERLGEEAAKPSRVTHRKLTR